MQKDIGIYVHIPFCRKKCYYCDFVSFANKNELIESYINALLREIENANIADKYNIKTVYIGGGTPSILESDNIKKILDALRTNIKEEAEITIEVNPGTVNKAKLENYRRFGINRLSIGLQSTNNNLLKQIGRIHNFEDFLKTYEEAKMANFENINIDLMLGLPNQGLEDIKKSLNEVISLEPNHISLYSLILEEGTELEKKVADGRQKMLDEELERKMYWETKKVLEENGYIHYEISNFARKRLYVKA